ncbi:MAG TPA: matrixin family metalloprotease [Fimbriiglobus sp.]|jgi:hypothetical protein
MKSPRRPFGIGFVQLEDRAVPTAFGIPWADPGHLTVSFAPDGTTTPRGPSDLAALSTSAGADWEREVLRAFQSWASVTNVNIGVVADGGQPIGSAGAVQGDPRFGDVRIAAAGLTPNALASASPFSWTGTTFAGDVLFNTNVPFRVNADTGTYDVFSVALHEAGHVFGLDHSALPGSAMNESYAKRVGLSDADRAAVQQIYGVRTPDANEGALGNDTAARATALKASGLVGRVVGDGDLTTTTDVDYYKFSTLPTLGLTSITLHLQAQGLSLLTPRVTVYNSAGQIVAQAQSTDPLNNDVALKFTNALFGGNFTVKVEGATDDVFGIGAYHLTVDTLNLTTPLPLLNSLLAPVTDGHLNDLLSTATDLTALAPKADNRFDATYRGVIEDRRDTDAYKVRAPAGGSGPIQLNVMVWGTDASPLAPRVKVNDSAGKPVAFRVLANEGGLFSVEVDGVLPGATYYISVSARDPKGDNATGSYFLGADFNTFDPTTFDGLTSGTIDSSASQTDSLHVSDASVFQFALAASSARAGDEIRMILEDNAGRVVFSLDATAGQPLVTTAAYLAAGNYTVRYSYIGSSPTPAVRYDLYLIRLSDDIGPYATQTTKPGGRVMPPTTSGGGNGYSYNGSSSANPNGQVYYF